MVVWAVTIPIFWYTTLDTLRRAERTRRAGELLVRVHSAVLAAWYVLIAVLVLVEFWDYWTTLL
jgi:hypothetical protein